MIKKANEITVEQNKIGACFHP